MSTAGKVIIIIAVCLIFLVVGVIGAGLYWWTQYGRQALESGAKTAHEAEELGKRTDNQGCLDESLERYKKDQGFGGVISTTIFLQTCLQESRPTPGFCDDVPGPNEFIASSAWQARKCKEAGIEDDQYCKQIFAQVQQWCARPRPKATQ